MFYKYYNLLNKPLSTLRIGKEKIYWYRRLERTLKQPFLLTIMKYESSF
jgi:hypothetical protein